MRYWLTLETADDHGRTDIELFTSSTHVIFEAKQGWLVPGEVQLNAYVKRFLGDRERRLVRCRTRRHGGRPTVLPVAVAGVPVEHWSWDEVRVMLRMARADARGVERIWLDQLEEYMGEATSKRPVTDALAYCVVVSDDFIRGSELPSLRQSQRVYFHPFATAGWPAVPPNFFAFRWANGVRQINRVVDYEVVASLTDRFFLCDR